MVLTLRYPGLCAVLPIRFIPIVIANVYNHKDQRAKCSNAAQLIQESCWNKGFSKFDQEQKFEHF